MLMKIAPRNWCDEIEELLGLIRITKMGQHLLLFGLLHKRCKGAIAKITTLYWSLEIANFDTDPEATAQHRSQHP